MSGKKWNVSAAVNTGETQKRIWIRVGTAFKAFPGEAYDVKLNLQALPLTAFSGAALELYLFPVEDREAS